MTSRSISPLLAMTLLALPACDAPNGGDSATGEEAGDPPLEEVPGEGIDLGEFCPDIQAPPLQFHLGATLSSSTAKPAPSKPTRASTLRIKRSRTSKPTRWAGESWSSTSSTATTIKPASRGARRCEPIGPVRDNRLVTGRALTLALHLLCTSAAAAAVVTLPGCWCGPEWAGIEPLELDTDADLVAVARVEDELDSYVATNLAVGAGGTVIAWGSRPGSPYVEDFVEPMQVGEHDLHAVWMDQSSWWVVGDAGTAAISVDHGMTWTMVDLGTTANLRGIANVGSRLVVVGNGVMLLQGGDGIWVEVLAPEGGWGDLRAIHYDGSRVYAVGLAGKAWSAIDPSGEWVAEDVGTDVDLFDLGARVLGYGSAQQVAIVGAAGTLLIRDGDGWTRVQTQLQMDFIRYENGFVLAAGGGVYEYGPKPRLRFVDTFERAQALMDSYDALLAVGTDGVAYEKGRYDCVGGRPFVVDGEVITATLRGDMRSETSSEFEDALARAWVEDGLVEHASVASFARFALELLSLGAPPSLLRGVQIAIADELRHTEACLGLARRFGSSVELGALQMPPSVLARAGDPVAIALALFEEGCINESLAACEAADAAGACEDVEIREVLEMIAADETRHATLAWGALRWLIDTHGEHVRAPLRRRLARLELRRPALQDGAFDPRLTAYGRLSPARRAHVHRRVLAELVSPLARALLGHDGLRLQGAA